MSEISHLTTIRHPYPTLPTRSPSLHSHPPNSSCWRCQRLRLSSCAFGACQIPHYLFYRRRFSIRSSSTVESTTSTTFTPSSPTNFLRSEVTWSCSSSTIDLWFTIWRTRDRYHHHDWRLSWRPPVASTSQVFSNGCDSSTRNSRGRFTLNWGERCVLPIWSWKIIWCSCVDCLLLIRSLVLFAAIHYLASMHFLTINHPSSSSKYFANRIRCPPMHWRRFFANASCASVMVRSISSCTNRLPGWIPFVPVTFILNVTTRHGPRTISLSVQCMTVGSRGCFDEPRFCNRTKIWAGLARFTSISSKVVSFEALSMATLHVSILNDTCPKWISDVVSRARPKATNARLKNSFENWMRLWRVIPDEVYSDEVYSDEMYPDEMYPDEMYPDEMYPNEMYPDEMYPDEVYSVYILTQTFILLTPTNLRWW